MKVLHSAALLRPPSGIVNQMRWEQAAAVALNLEWDTRMFCPAGAIENSPISEFSRRVSAGKKSKLLKARAWWRLRHEYHQWLFAQEPRYDIFLLRYYPHDPFQLAFVRHARKPTFLVHHTLEGPELAGNGLAGQGRDMLDRLVAGATIRAATGVIGVTQEIIDYELCRAHTPKKPSIVYPNGILYRGSPADDERGRIPEFLFVASAFAPWHGLDLLLDDMARSTNAQFILHLVGDVSGDDLHRAKADRRVQLHGRLTQSEIKHIASRCWLGLSSFALFRQKMTQACTLKVREYLMLGLPVYAGYEEVFTKQFPYYMHGLPKVANLLECAKKVRGDTREVVAEQSRPFIDKKLLLNELHQQQTVLRK